MKSLLYTQYKKILADVITPVSAYLKIRDKFPNSLLLESSDYHTSENSFSYICCNPIAYIKIEHNEVAIKYPQEPVTISRIKKKKDTIQHISDFVDSFKVKENDLKFVNNGLFGYLSYDMIQYFEDVAITKKDNAIKIPEAYYAVYQNIIAIDHFKNEAYIFCHSNQPNYNNIDEIEQVLYAKNFSSYPFYTSGDVESLLSDEEFLKYIESAKHHCQIGDVFQLVLSRQFSQKFKGDEFNVYRALRSINPSPYLFFFDYGNFKIFGSSPEAQLIVGEGKAEIHPIAGTFKRTSNDIQDAKLAEELSKDRKENAEHTMLVDLARNDLSRHSSQVKVDKYREVQFFSHVIHLVSKVIANLDPKADVMQVVADTFPAGTLSGAPKYRAMQLINQYENYNRSFYAGAIGFMGFDKSFNHAIMIRTFLSQGYKLYYQAGAGIVSESDPKNELQEVYNKLEALNKAIEIAQSL